MNPQLKVSLSDFVSALNKVKLANRAMRKGQASFSFENGELWIRAQGVAVHMEAEGLWPGMARVTLFLLRPLLGKPPIRDPMIIRYEEGKLRIESYSMECVWQDIYPKQIELPLDMSLVEILKLRYHYSEAELISSGIMPKIEEAEAKAFKTIAEIAKKLESFGISEEDLLKLLENKLKSQS